MPQLNPEFFVSQLFWLAIFFILLFVILWRFSLPRIATVIEKRQDKINDNLSAAKELQEKAQIIEKKINDHINKAKNDTDEKIKKTIISLQDNVSSQLSKFDKELEDKISKSEKEILRNRDNQIKNINNEIENITRITVSKIANINISAKDISTAIEAQKETLN